MVTNKKVVSDYALNSLSDIASFARFVNYAEGLSQIEELFKNESSKDHYHQVWFELEIVNALALSEWESDGSPLDWKKRWESEYKQEASELVNQLLDMLI